jgi:cell volume regulation protein A
LNRVDLGAGLHAPFVVAAAVAIYSVAALLDGSGFLAAYLAGLVLGNRPFRAFANVTSFHDAATWLAQIVMFVMLGLLVTPSRLLEYAIPALIVAVALIVVARPIAVVLCLLPARFGKRETAFISWVGLRGAVGIFLASIPMLSGLPNAELYFNAAFFVVLVSLVVQGWTIAPMARRLRLALPQRHVDVRRVELDLPGQLESEIVGYQLTPDSPILATRQLPSWARPLLLVRTNKILPPPAITELRVGDYLYVLAPPWRVYLLDPLFQPPREEAPERGAEFMFSGETRLGTVTDLYGLSVPTGQAESTMADHFADTLSEQPVVGDRIEGEGYSLVVRQMDEERVGQVGLRLHGEAPVPSLRGTDAPKRILKRLLRRFAGP